MRYEQMGAEIWKDIYGYGGDYQVSNHGRIRSCKYGDYRIRKHFLAGHGYPAIDLCREGKYKKEYIHRLVAKYFRKNPRNMPEVNHKDGVKTNNYYKNLEWTDFEGNRKHSIEVLGFTFIHNAKFTETQVKKVKRLLKNGLSQAEIARKTNVTRAVVYNIAHELSWKHIKI